MYRVVPYELYSDIQVAACSLTSHVMIDRRHAQRHAQRYVFRYQVPSCSLRFYAARVIESPEMSQSNNSIM